MYSFRKINLFILLVTLVTCFSLLRAGDFKYKVISRYSTDNQGKILKQEPFSGKVILYDTGKYYVSLHIEDTGIYKYVKKNTSLANDTIYFTSDKKFQFIAYPKGNNLAIWLYKKDGTNIWAYAQLSPENGSANSNQVTGKLVVGPVFNKVTMYGSTSSPSYSRYDDSSGAYLGDDTLGIVFRPDGSYSLRLDFAGTVRRDSGGYTVRGKNVRLVFSDGSFMDLTLVNGGKSLHWLANGILIGEYHLLGRKR